VTFTVFLQASALLAAAPLTCDFWQLQFFDNLSMDVLFFGIVAIVTRAETGLADKSYLETVTVSFLAFGLPTVAAFTVRVYWPEGHSRLDGRLFDFHLANGIGDLFFL
jgi:hypothetical protein